MFYVSCIFNSFQQVANPFLPLPTMTTLLLNPPTRRWKPNLKSHPNPSPRDRVLLDVPPSRTTTRRTKSQLKSRKANLRRRRRPRTRASLLQRLAHDPFSRQQNNANKIRKMRRKKARVLTHSLRKLEMLLFPGLHCALLTLSPAF